jgi:hypothetical protein
MCDNLLPLTKIPELKMDKIFLREIDPSENIKKSTSLTLLFTQTHEEILLLRLTQIT